MFAGQGLMTTGFDRKSDERRCATIVEHMRTFEVYLNGEKLCVAGIEMGRLLFSIACGENKQGRGDIGLGMTASTLKDEILRWQQRKLQIGDHVLIKIVEADTVDVPTVLQTAPRDSRKYEKAYVRRMAKEFGWTITTGRRSGPRKQR